MGTGSWVLAPFFAAADRLVHLHLLASSVGATYLAHNTILSNHLITILHFAPSQQRLLQQPLEEVEDSVGPPASCPTVEGKGHLSLALIPARCTTQRGKGRAEQSSANLVFQLDED